MTTVEQPPGFDSDGSDAEIMSAWQPVWEAMQLASGSVTASSAGFFPPTASFAEQPTSRMWVLNAWATPVQSSWELVGAVDQPHRFGAPMVVSTANANVGGGFDTASRRVFEITLLSAVGARLHQLLWSGPGIDVRQLGDPEQLAVTMVAALPGSHVFDEIAGPFYDSRGLARWLDISTEELERRTAERLLLGCPVEEGEIVYPAWQFADNGATLPQLPEVIRTLAAASNDSWQIAIWLRSPSRVLDGETPSEWLRRFNSADAVLRLARRTAARWAQ